MTRQLRTLSCLIVVPGLGLLAGCTTTPPRVAARTCYHASEAFETEVGYCQAVRSGNTLYISGSAAQGNMPDAIRSVYRKLAQALEANGLSFTDVVKENVFATDLDAFIVNKALRKEFYANTPLPAATWVQVQRLYTPALVLEVELVAEYKK